MTFIACRSKPIQYLLHNLCVAAVAETEDCVFVLFEEVDLVSAARYTEVCDICSGQLADFLRQRLALASLISLMMRIA